MTQYEVLVDVIVLSKKI